MQLPPDFISRAKIVLNLELKDFIKGFSEPKPTSVRFNKNKSSISTIQNRVPWSKNSYYLKYRPFFFKDPSIYAGKYYVQEASSMFIEHIINQVFNQKNAVKILDLCSAPGGKSTLISSLFSNDSLLIANEVEKKRVTALEENLTRWGNINCLISSSSISKFRELNEFFDLILVDAPCSGEGMFRKDYKAIERWSPKLVQNCANLQKEIIDAVIPSLKKEGFLIYSTCTFSEEENEKNIEYAINNHTVRSVPVEYHKEWGITETKKELNEETQYGYRFYPHKVKGEGFFCSLLQKVNSSKTSLEEKRHQKVKKEKGDTYSLITNNKSIKKSQIESILNLIEESLRKEVILIEKKYEVFAIPRIWQDYLEDVYKKLNVLKLGIKVCTIKIDNIIPSHELALSNIINPDLPYFDLNYKEAILFLKKHPFDLDTNGKKGWFLVKYKNLNLGWVKCLGNRFNNYYPKNLILKKDFDVSECEVEKRGIELLVEGI